MENTNGEYLQEIICRGKILCNFEKIYNIMQPETILFPSLYEEDYIICLLGNNL